MEYHILHCQKYCFCIIDEGKTARIITIYKNANYTGSRQQLLGSSQKVAKV